jgi:hypothetical protein
MGVGWRSLGRLQHCQRIQYCSKDTAADPDIVEPGDMDPVLLL